MDNIDVWRPGKNVHLHEVQNICSSTLICLQRTVLLFPINLGSNNITKFELCLSSCTSDKWPPWSARCARWTSHINNCKLVSFKIVAFKIKASSSSSASRSGKTCVRHLCIKINKIYQKIYCTNLRLFTELSLESLAQFIPEQLHDKFYNTERVHKVTRNLENIFYVLAVIKCIILVHFIMLKTMFCFKSDYIWSWTCICWKSWTTSSENDESDIGVIVKITTCHGGSFLLCLKYESLLIIHHPTNCQRRSHQK